MFTVGEKIAFIESAFGKANVSRDLRNVAVWCPTCCHSDRNKRKLVIRTSDDANHCWVCDWKAKSLAPLLRKFAPTFLETYRTQFNPDACVGIDVDETFTKLTLPQDFRLLALASVDDHLAHVARNYVFRRGVSDDDLWYYKLGVSNDAKFNGRVIVPSFDATGELNFVSARSLGHARPKYYNSEVPRAGVIFNEINVDWSKRLVLCEGAFDMMKCGQNAVAMLGAELSEEYALFDRIVMHGTPVVLALDDDMDNRKFALAQKFASYDIDVYVIDLGKFHDPGDMSKGDFDEALKSACKWDWNVFFHSKLKNAARMSLRLS